MPLEGVEKKNDEKWVDFPKSQKKLLSTVIRSACHVKKGKLRNGGDLFSGWFAGKTFGSSKNVAHGVL